MLVLLMSTITYAGAKEDIYGTSIWSTGFRGVEASLRGRKHKHDGLRECRSSEALCLMKRVTRPFSSSCFLFHAHAGGLLMAGSCRAKLIDNKLQRVRSETFASDSGFLKGSARQFTIGDGRMKRGLNRLLLGCWCRQRLSRSSERKSI